VSVVNSLPVLDTHRSKIVLFILTPPKHQIGRDKKTPAPGAGMEEFFNFLPRRSANLRSVTPA
jgi:hypothetical protein